MQDELMNKTQSYTSVLSKALDGNQKLKDTYFNESLDLGYGTEDPTVQGGFPHARMLTWNLQRIEALIRSDFIFERALTWRSKAPLQNGIDLNSDEIDAERIVEFNEHRECILDSELQYAMYEADAFGWSALIILVDGETSPSALKRPLDITNIKKDSLLGFKKLTRWYNINPTNKFISSEHLGSTHHIYDPALLGTPLYYKVNFEGDQGGNQYDVHRSRLIIISRNQLSFIEKKVEHYGGTSILEQGFEALNRYHTVIGQISRIINKSIVPKLKIGELGSTALQSDKGQENFDKKMLMMRRELSNHNILVLGEDDDLTFEQANLAGFGEILKEHRLYVSASFNTPPHELFFDKMEYDEEECKNFIRERQKWIIKPIYKQMLPMLYLNKYGEKMPDFIISFKPLGTMNVIDMANARKTNVETLEILYKNGFYDKPSAQNTLPDIDNNPTDVFRNLTKEYRKRVSNGEVGLTYIDDQILLAEALNKDDEASVEEKVGGRSRGGDPKHTKKPTPKVKVSEE